MPTQKLHPNDSLAHLSAQIKQFAQDRAWDQFHNPKDLALSMVLESAEVLEHFQWKDEKAITRHLAKNKDEIADELVDTLWYLLTIAYKLNIDLPHSFERKYQINTKKYPVKKAYGNNKKILI